MKVLRYALLATLITLFSAGCGVLNAFVPDVEVADGAFGLGGANGTEVTGSFAAAANLSTQAASGTFTINKTFADLKDLQDERIKGLDNLKTKIGMALYTGDVAVKLVNAANSFPASITVTGASLKITLSDASGEKLELTATVPAGFTSVKLSKQASCTAECGYTASTADIAKLKTLFDLLVNGANGEKLLKILKSGGENTLVASATLNVSNDASDFTGSSVKIKLGESGTTVKVRAF